MIGTLSRQKPRSWETFSLAISPPYSCQLHQQQNLRWSWVQALKLSQMQWSLEQWTTESHEMNAEPSLRRKKFTPHPSKHVLIEKHVTWKSESVCPRPRSRKLCFSLTYSMEHRYRQTEVALQLSTLHDPLLLDKPVTLSQEIRYQRFRRWAYVR